MKDEKHTRDLQTLKKQLTDKGFVLPAFLGGIEGAVKVLVLLRKTCCEKRIKGTLLGQEFFCLGIYTTARNVFGKIKKGIGGKSQ